MRLSKRPAQYVKKIERTAKKSRDLTDRHSKRKEFFRNLLYGKPINYRGYKDYNELFERGLNKSIVDTLAEIGKKKLDII